MRLMIIEDKANDVRGIIDYAASKGWETKLLGFQEGISELDEYNPDIVVLDMKNDATEEEMSGAPIFNLIWKNKFRPTILFSGYADVFSIEDAEIAAMAQEPLFKRILKGDEQPVIEQLDYLADIVPSITRIRKRLNAALISSASAIPTIKASSAQASDEVLDYLFSSRITQFFQKTVMSEKLPAWVQYILPPIGKQLFTGDILRCLETEESEDDKFAIVLTPSCDLSFANDDAYVLIALNTSFSSIDNAFNLVRAKGTPKYNDRRTRMGSTMNTGYKDSKIYLPHVRGILPDLCFDLKHIALIRITSIMYNSDPRTRGAEWIRVASLCSPYRERASWAYLHTACRPGVPTLDTDNWVDEIFE